MSIVMRCECGKRWQFKDHEAGKKSSCPSCGARLRVPQPESPAELPEPPAPALAAPIIAPGAATATRPARHAFPPALRMVLMTPLAGAGAFLIAAVTLLVGGALTHGLVWLTGGITALTGRIFVFQIFLVLAVIVMVGTMAYGACIVSARLLSELVVGAATDARGGEPTTGQRALAALLCAPVAFAAYYGADTLVWSLAASFFLAGTWPSEADQARLSTVRMEMEAAARHERKGITPDPVRAAERFQEEKHLEKTIRERRRAEEQFAPYAFNHRWLRWVGCVAAAMTALFATLNPSAVPLERMTC